MPKHSNAHAYRYEIVCGGTARSKVVPCNSQADYDDIASQLKAGHNVNTTVGVLTPRDLPLLLRPSRGRKMPAPRKAKAKLPPPLPMEGL